MATALDIKLKRADRIYHPSDVVSGVIIVVSKGSLSHGGITLVCEGVVQLQLSAKSVGLFEAFYNSIKPITMISLTIEIAKAGKLPDGVSELPFEFRLEPALGQQLYETYHGVFVNITYTLRCDMRRGVLAKDMSKSVEFVVEVATPKADPTAAAIADPRTGRPIDGAVVPFTITPESIDNVKKGSKRALPKFELVGRLDSALCDITKPFTGEITVKESEAAIKSIELQLVRVETCGCADGYAKESTEIQNIQIADGDIARGIPLRLHMVFPRLFTCPSIASRTFKIEFEVNLVVMFEDNHLITESFPIKLIRP